MIVTLYKNTSEPERLDKSLTHYKTFSNVNIKTPSSIIDPVLILKSDSALTGCNYLYIEEFKRYYFIKNISCIHGNDSNNFLYQITAHVDVLTSFKDGIRQQHAIIARQEKNYNLLVQDSQISFLANPKVSQETFPKGFPPDAKLILITMGQ